LGFDKARGDPQQPVAALPRHVWSAVNINRRIIELRATQAKTAARHILPMSDTQAVWYRELMSRLT